MVTSRLLGLRDGLRRYGVRGSLLLDGSYISVKPEPGDFDVMLIAEPGIDALKSGEPSLAEMLDPVEAERNGYSMLYAQTDSSVLPLLRTIWDVAKGGTTTKGVVEVAL